MKGPDFDHFCRIVRERSGLILGPEKAYLVQTRLAPIAESAGLPDVEMLLAHVHSGVAGHALINSCIDAMATHESSFFRDGTPFRQLSEILLPDFLTSRANSRTLRIWSAACSTGQEPYSIAMTLRQHAAKLSGWHIEIIATDLTEHAISRARLGKFTAFEVGRGLTPEQVNRWFNRNGDWFEITPELRNMVSFRVHNLLDGTNGLGIFDVIFCRNVLIYFDPETKRRTLASLGLALAADGVLFLGSAENVISLTTNFLANNNQRGLFRPVAEALKVTAP